eukprot:1699100-Prymnesium_polylepis.2
MACVCAEYGMRVCLVWAVLTWKPSTELTSKRPPTSPPVANAAKEASASEGRAAGRGGQRIRREGCRERRPAHQEGGLQGRGAARRKGRPHTRGRAVGRERRVQEAVGAGEALLGTRGREGRGYDMLRWGRWAALAWSSGGLAGLARLIGPGRTALAWSSRGGRGFGLG